MRRRVLLPIVLIEDDPDDLFFFARRLQRCGVKNPVTTFGDAIEALRYFERQESLSSSRAVAVVFTDIKMPRLDGFNLVKSLRKMKSLARVPVYVVSGSSLEVDQTSARQAGASGFLQKFPADELLREIVDRANDSPH